MPLPKILCYAVFVKWFALVFPIFIPSFARNPLQNITYQAWAFSPIVAASVDVLKKRAYSITVEYVVGICRI